MERSLSRIRFVTKFCDWFTMLSFIKIMFVPGLIAESCASALGFFGATKQPAC
jgi:hypothetical protein